MKQLVSLLKRIGSGSLVLQIIIGILAGVALAVVAPEAAKSAGMFGSLFVKALKAVAPILVFVIVSASIANQKKGTHTNMGSIVGLYKIGRAHV